MMENKILHLSTLLLEISQSSTDVSNFIDLPLNHPDVIQINPEREPVGIDAVRQMQRLAVEKPYQSDKKYLIVYDIDHSTVEAQNALLKLTEEPPAHVQIILTCQYVHAVLPTIISRAEVIYADEKVEKPTNSLTELIKSSLSERMNRAGEWSSGSAITVVLDLIESGHRELETEPSLALLNAVKVCQQAYQALRVNTNSRLTLEWLVMQI